MLYTKTLFKIEILIMITNTIPFSDNSRFANVYFLTGIHLNASCKYPYWWISKHICNINIWFHKYNFDELHPQHIYEKIDSVYWFVKCAAQNLSFLPWIQHQHYHILPLLESQFSLVCHSISMTYHGVWIRKIILN
jgi:hypothetical protein